MPTCRINEGTSIGGVSFSSNVSRTAEGQIGQEISVPVAKTGTLSTRTDNDTGTITISNHAYFVDGDICDIYWSGGRRYGMAVSSTATSTFVLGASTTGEGDNLPSQGTTVYVCKVVTISSTFNGDEVELLTALSTQAGMCVFRNADPATVFATDLVAGEMFSWKSGQNITNPLSGEVVTEIRISTSSTSTVATAKVGALYDSVP